MKAHVFQNLQELNTFLAEAKESKIFKIKYKSFIVDDKKDENGIRVWEIVDRFLVIEK